MPTLQQPSTSAPLADRVLTAVTEVLGLTSAVLPLHEPEFAGREWDYVKECLDTGWVSSVGSYVDRFEKDLATFTGARRGCRRSTVRSRSPTTSSS